MSPSRLSFAAGLVLLLGGFGGVALRRDRDVFDHEKHRKVFPECEGCHAGIKDPSRPVFPPATVCATCHDGVVQRTVDWSAPPERPSNLRFTHAKHYAKSAGRLPADSVLACRECHIPAGAAWMTVQRTIPAQCLACHGVRTAHLSAPDTACVTCHLPLAQATALPLARVAAFGKPPWHDDPGFLTATGHGAMAKQGNRSCAVCHARDFCAQCHVNAPDVRAIQALAPDPRSLVFKEELKAPASHQDSKWLSRHGGSARRDVASCASCHTRQSCMVCHRSRPEIVLALPDSGSGRGIGARITLKEPGYHGRDFADRHAAPAKASPGSCNACHTRAECLECHRPNPGAAGSYHPAGFLTRHPAAAFNRQVDCTACHNQGAVLRHLPPAGGRGVHQRSAAAGLPRCRRRVRAQPWRRGAPEHRVLRGLPLRAGLPDLPLRAERPPVRSARPGIRPGTAAAPESSDVRRLPRKEHPGG